MQTRLHTVFDITRSAGAIASSVLNQTSIAFGLLNPIVGSLIPHLESKSSVIAALDSTNSGSMGSSTSNSLRALTLLAICLGAVCFAANAHSSSDGDYYAKTCPLAKTIVKETVNKILKKDKNLAGGLLRLHFHDCFVRGCDASILLDSASGTGEKDALSNARSARGFDQIEEIKAALEVECPGIVSCADVLALAARDATVKVGGPSWNVNLGRKDGFVTSEEEALQALPSPLMSFDELVSNFAAVGLNRDEMVVLSGAHTIGRSTCESVEPRLYNFNNVSGLTDPSLDSTLAKELKTKCPEGEDGSILNMDSTKNTFDHLYFKAVLQNKGLFHSDAQFLANSVGKELVQKYSQPGSSFSADFQAAMVKMSNIAWASQGEVRRKCSAVNN